MFVSFSFSVYIINRKKKEEVSRPGFGLVMNFFFNTLIHNEFFFLRVCACMLFFFALKHSAGTFFCVDGVEKVVVRRRD